MVRDPNLALPRRRLLVALSALGLSARAENPLKVFGDDHYRPLMYSDSGRPAGVLVQLLRQLEPLTGDRYACEMLAWNQAMLRAERGEGGLIGVSFNQQRARWLDYSEPVYYDDIQVVVRRGQAFPFAKLEDLRGKTLGIGNGVSYGDELDQVIASGAIKVERDWGIDKRLRMLLSGRLDAAFVGNGREGYEAALRLDPSVLARREELEVLPHPAVRDPLHLGFPKRMKAREALDRVNHALGKLAKS